jgi:hypothetical protein
VTNPAPTPAAAADDAESTDVRDGIRDRSVREVVERTRDVIRKTRELLDNSRELLHRVRHGHDRRHAAPVAESLSRQGRRVLSEMNPRTGQPPARLAPTSDTNKASTPLNSNQCRRARCLFSPAVTVVDWRS